MKKTLLLLLIATSVFAQKREVKWYYDVISKITKPYPADVAIDPSYLVATGADTGDVVMPWELAKYQLLITNLSDTAKYAELNSDPTYYTNFNYAVKATEFLQGSDTGSTKDYARSVSVIEANRLAYYLAHALVDTTDIGNGKILIYHDYQWVPLDTSVIGGGGGGAGVSVHSALSNLSYATAGHSGFQPTIANIADTSKYLEGGDTLSLSLRIDGKQVSGVYLIPSDSTLLHNQIEFRIPYSDTTNGGARQWELDLKQWALGYTPGTMARLDSSGNRDTTYSKSVANVLGYNGVLVTFAQKTAILRLDTTYIVTANDTIPERGYENLLYQVKGTYLVPTDSTNNRTFSDLKYSLKAGSSSIVTVGALTAGSIGSGFTSIDSARLANIVSKITSANTFLTVGANGGMAKLITLDTTKYGTAAMTGFIKYTDWVNFNAKQAAIPNLDDTAKYVETSQSYAFAYNQTSGQWYYVYRGTDDSMHTTFLDTTFFITKWDTAGMGGGGSGSGTVTSIATSDGILGGTITTTGTLKADTTFLVTRWDTLSLSDRINLRAPLASPTFTGTFTAPVGLTGTARLASGVLSATASDSIGLGVALYGKRGTGDSSGVSGTAGKYITPTMVATAYAPISHAMTSHTWANDWMMAYSNGSGLAELAIGGINTHLRSAGGDQIPQWVAPDSTGIGVLLYGKRGTGDSSSVAGTAGKYITPTMVAATYRAMADSSATSGTAGKYITPTMVATTYATKADTQNQIRKYTVLMQAGVGSDSVCVTTSYKIPMGISTGFTVDSVMIIQMRTGGSLPSVRYRVNFGTDISAAGTLVDTTTATSYTTVTAQGGANINGTAAIPPGAIVWLDFPTVTVAPKTFLVVLLGHRSP
jgi:hypothetical protein